MFVLILLSVSVYAQGRITDMMRNMGTFIFEDFGSMGGYGFKFLLWICLFSLFNWGLKRARFDQKVSGIISFSLSLATVILISGEAVIKIFSIYAYIIILILGVFIPLILFWIIHKNFNGEDWGHTLIRSVLYFIMGGALFWFTANANTLLSLTG